MNIHDYIKQHNHINYCEALIYPDGTIEDATPSHLEFLIKVTNESKDDINKKMPAEASPVPWLVDYTKCVALWYNFCYLPESFTSAQAFTIAELIKANIIANPYIGNQLKEKAIIERNQKYITTNEFDEIERKVIPFYM